MLTLVYPDGRTKLLLDLTPEEQQQELEKVAHGEVQLECRCHPNVESGPVMTAFRARGGLFHPRKLPLAGPRHHIVCPRYALDAHVLANWGWAHDVIRHRDGNPDRMVIALDTSLLPFGSIGLGLPDTKYRLPGQDRTIIVKRRATLLGLLRLAWARGRLNINDPTISHRTPAWERLRWALTQIEVSDVADSEYGLAELTLFPHETNSRIVSNNCMTMEKAYGRRRVLFACLLTDPCVDNYALDEYCLGDVFGTDLYIPAGVMANARRFTAGTAALKAGRPTVAFGVATVKQKKKNAMAVADRVVLEAVTEGLIPVHSLPEYEWFTALTDQQCVYERILVFDGDKFDGLHPDCDILDTEHAHFPWEVYFDRDERYGGHRIDKEVRFDGRFGDCHGYWRADHEDIRAALARLPQPRPGARRPWPYPFYS